MRVLITGACGFIGHFLTSYLFEKTSWELLLVDHLSYASEGLSRLKAAVPWPHPRIQLYTFDLTQAITPGLSQEWGIVDYVIHLAADTHVDRSISDPVGVVMNNIQSTLQLLEWVRHCSPPPKFLYFSTDEVFGPAFNGQRFQEDDRFHPNNPYAAAKAAGECLVQSYANTYRLSTIITHCTNVYGPRQHSEKFIPLVLDALAKGETILIHGYPDRVKSGSRYYIHVADVANALHCILEKGTWGESYNITGEEEVSNLELARTLAELVGKPFRYEIVDFHSARPGHDLHYGLDGSKLRALGWTPQYDLRSGLRTLFPLL